MRVVLLRWEIARREQLKAFVTGTIAGLGSHYVLTVEAVNAESGEVMAREQVDGTGHRARQSTRDR